MRVSQSTIFALFILFCGSVGAEDNQNANARNCGIAISASHGAVVTLSMPGSKRGNCREAGDGALSNKHEITTRDALIEALKKENSELRSNQLKVVLKKSGESLRDSFPNEVKDAYLNNETQTVTTYLAEQEGKAALLASEANQSAAQYALETAYVLYPTNQKLALDALRRAIEYDPSNVNALLAISLELVLSIDSVEAEKYLSLLRREFLSEKYKTTNQLSERVNFLEYSLIEVANSISRGELSGAFESTKSAVAYSQALIFDSKGMREIDSIARVFRFYATLFEVMEKIKDGKSSESALFANLVNFANKEYGNDENDRVAYYLLVSSYLMYIDHSVERGQLIEANRFYESISASVRSMHEKSPEDRHLTLLYAEVLRVGGGLKKAMQSDMASQLMLQRLTLIKAIYSKDIDNATIVAKLAGAYLDFLETNASSYSEAEIDSYRRNLYVVMDSLDSRSGVYRSADVENLFSRFSSYLLDLGRFKEVVNLLARRLDDSPPTQKSRLDKDVRASVVSYIILARAFAGLKQWNASIDSMSKARVEMEVRSINGYNDIGADWAYYYDNYYWISMRQGGCKAAVNTLNSFFSYYGSNSDLLSRNGYVQTRLAEFYKRLERCESKFDARLNFNLIRAKHSAAAYKLDEKNFIYFSNHLNAQMDLAVNSMLVSRPADAQKYIKDFEQLARKCVSLFGGGHKCIEYEALGSFALAVAEGSDSSEFRPLLWRSIELYRSILGLTSEVGLRLNLVNALSMYATGYPTKIDYEEVVTVLGEAHRVALGIDVSELNDYQVNWVADLKKWLDSGDRKPFSQTNWYIYGVSK